MTVIVVADPAVIPRAKLSNSPPAMLVMVTPLGRLTCTGILLSGICPVAQFAKHIVAPGPDRAVRRKGQTVISPSRDVSDGHPAGQADLHRNITVGICPVAQFAIIIVAPGPDRAVRREGQTVITPHPRC